MESIRFNSISKIANDISSSRKTENNKDELLFKEGKLEFMKDLPSSGYSIEDLVFFDKKNLDEIL